MVQTKRSKNKIYSLLVQGSGIMYVAVVPLGKAYPEINAVVLSLTNDINGFSSFFLFHRLALYSNAGYYFFRKQCGLIEIEFLLLIKSS